MPCRRRLRKVIIDRISYLTSLDHCKIELWSQMLIKLNKFEVKI